MIDITVQHTLPFDAATLPAPYYSSPDNKARHQQTIARTRSAEAANAVCNPVPLPLAHPCACVGCRRDLAADRVACAQSKIASPERFVPTTGMVGPTGALGPYPDPHASTWLAAILQLYAERILLDTNPRARVCSSATP